MRPTIPAVLLVALASLETVACRKPDYDLRQPVGEATSRAGVSPADAGTTGPGRSGDTPPSSNDHDLAQSAPGPCGMERLPSISFSFGSAQLDASEDLEIRRVARCLAQPPFDDARLIVIGHADPVGAATHNLALGLERATTVMRRFGAYGIAQERIVVTSAGEVVLPRERWDEARRVDLLIGRDGGPAAPKPHPPVQGIPIEGVEPAPP